MYQRTKTITCIGISDPKSFLGWGGRGQESPGQGRETKREVPSYLTPKSTVAKVVEHVPSADFKASDISNLEVGQKVEHQKFGFGEVIKKEGAAHNPIATIKFENNGEKKIMLNYAKLRIIEN